MVDCVALLAVQRFFAPMTRLSIGTEVTQFQKAVQTLTSISPAGAGPSAFYAWLKFGAIRYWRAGIFGACKVRFGC